MLPLIKQCVSASMAEFNQICFVIDGVPGIGKKEILRHLRDMIDVPTFFDVRIPCDVLGFFRECCFVRAQKILTQRRLVRDKRILSSKKHPVTVQIRDTFSTGLMGDAVLHVTRSFGAGTCEAEVQDCEDRRNDAEEIATNYAKMNMKKVIRIRISIWSKDAKRRILDSYGPDHPDAYDARILKDFAVCCLNEFATIPDYADDTNMFFVDFDDDPSVVAAKIKDIVVKQSEAHGIKVSEKRATEST